MSDKDDDAFDKSRINEISGCIQRFVCGLCFGTDVRNNTVVYQDVGVFHNGVFTVTGDDSRSIFD